MRKTPQQTVFRQSNTGMRTKNASSSKITIPRLFLGLRRPKNRLPRLDHHQHRIGNRPPKIRIDHRHRAQAVVTNPTEAAHRRALENIQAAQVRNQHLQNPDHQHHPNRRPKCEHSLPEKEVNPQWTVVHRLQHSIRKMTKTQYLHSVA